LLFGLSLGGAPRDVRGNIQQAWDQQAWDQQAWDQQAWDQQAWRRQHRTHAPETARHVQAHPLPAGWRAVVRDVT
jgi:hypothetical protein